MTVRLRAHHLLCVLTYVGKGYSPAFVANLDRIAARLAAGEPVQMVAGPDDVCAPVRDDPSHHCNDPAIRRRDRLASLAVGRLLHQPVTPGRTLSLTPERLRLLRAAFVANHIRAACAGCAWARLCTEVAAHGFHATRLLGAHARAPGPVQPGEV